MFNLFAKIVNRTRTDLYRGRGIVAPGHHHLLITIHQSSIDRIHLLSSSSVPVGSHSRGAIMPKPTEIFERGITGFGITVITMLRLGCLKS